MPAPDEVVERVLEPSRGIPRAFDQHGTDTPDIFQAQTAHHGEHGGRLEVVEGRDHAWAEEAEGRGRGPPIEVDEDPLDRVPPGHLSGQRDDLRDEQGVDPNAREDRRERRRCETAREHVGVERIDEGVGLPVVAEAELACLGRDRQVATEQLDELEPDVLAEIAELAAPQLLELVLEHDAVVRHPVQGELGTDRLADLGRARGDEVDERRLAA